MPLKTSLEIEWIAHNPNDNPPSLDRRLVGESLCVLVLTEENDMPYVFEDAASLEDWDERITWYAIVPMPKKPWECDWVEPGKEKPVPYRTRESMRKGLLPA